ncbi:MAG: hypothetical protein Q9172_007391 [Xanthocarpia lactea]
MGSASNPISHHTSHTLSNGASSSNRGAYGDSENACDDGSDDGTSASSDVSSLKSACSLHESEGSGKDTVTEDSSPSPSGYLSIPECQYEPSSEGKQVKRDAETGGTTVSMASTRRSSGNLSNFKIIDSTLREGEQFATAFFDTAQKIEIAKALDHIGVDYLELTSPAASEQSRLDCETICKLGLKAKILTHIRCHMDDARIAVRTGVSGVNVAIGTSSYLMEHSHGKDMDYISTKAKEVIQYVKSHGLEIRFSGEDSFRSDFNDLLNLYTTVDRLGVNRVGIADTVGSASPMDVIKKVGTIREAVNCDIETHFHNDTGCAIANAYCALEAGATHIDTTVLGIGERNGITPLGGLMVSIMATDREYILSKYRIEQLGYVESLVAQAVQVEIPFDAWKIEQDSKHREEVHENEIMRG